MLKRLATVLNEASACVQEISGLTCDEIDPGPHLANPLNPARKPRPSRSCRRTDPPIADHDTLSILWAGKRCHLGYTLPFKLFERLARRPNCYVPYSQLLDNVWCQCRSDAAIRSVVKELKRKLIEAEMAELAGAIKGESRCYGLILESLAP